MRLRAGAYSPRGHLATRYAVSIYARAWEEGLFVFLRLAARMRTGKCNM